MGQGRRAAPDAVDAGRSVADLYAELTGLMATTGLGQLSIHRGLWGPETETVAESLDRAKRTLVQGCRLGPDRHVLDAGCGVGGTAIFLAETHGARVTGLTNCAPQIAVAERHAHERGVAHLVEFRHGDFMELPFADAAFDVVLNHESLCYATDKLAYLRGVRRVLKPGGRWRSLDGELATGQGPLPERHDALVASVERNWRLPSYRAWRTVLAMAEEAGLTDIEDRDLTAEALPSTDRLRQGYLLFTFLNPQIRETNPGLQEAMDGSVSFAEGLADGLFVYRLIGATRPIG